MSKEKKLINKRNQFKDRLNRLCIYFDAIDQNNLTENIIEELQFRLEKIDPIMDEFNEVQLEIHSLLDDENPSNAERQEFEDSFYKITSAIKTIIKKFNSNQVKNEVVRPPSTETRKIKLPTIRLPTFDGSYDHWLEFRDSFNALVHNDSTISKSEKFYYLKSSMEGPASQLLQSIEVTDENYPEAMRLLQDRFENKKLIIYNHIDAIFELPNAFKESHVILRQIYDNDTKHLRSLASLKQPVDQWDTLLIYIISKKLDPVTRRDWEAFEYTGDLPTMNDMNRFLKNKCELLEKIQCNNKTPDKVDYNKKVDPRANSPKKVQSNFSSDRGSDKVKCYFCQKPHTIYYCEDFIKLSIENRLKGIKKLNLCVNCLRPRHSAQNCNSSGCKRCNKRHNTLLHLEPIDNVQSDTSLNDTQGATSAQVVAATNISNLKSSQVLLSTAIIQVTDSNGLLHYARALLDSGSQGNFISENLCEKLNLPRSKVDYAIVGVGQAMTDVTHKTSINISTNYSKYSAKVLCLVLPKITDPLPTVSFDINELKLPTNIILADPTFNKRGHIDILLGSNIFWELIKMGQVNLGKGRPMLRETQVGWVIAGNLLTNPRFKNSINCLSIHMRPSIDDQLLKFWQLEDYQTSPKFLCKSDQFCESQFSKTTKRDSEGRFIVSIPFNESLTELGESRQVALDRFKSLERKLQLGKNSQLKNEYVSFMCEYEQLGHMKRVLEQDSDKLTYYLPHHAVVKDTSLTTRVRVVFDASAKTESGLSLNDVQYSGPTIQNDLFTIILQFRLYQYVMTADISKMYRQILVNPNQRHFQRIFWRSEPTDDLKCYELQTVTYGTASAPFLAVRCLLQLALENENKYPIASDVIKNNFYMDDLLTGSNSIDDLLQIQEDVSSILSSAGFELRKWLSNRPDILQQFKVNDGDKQEHKTLGVVWNSINDTIQYSICDINYDKVVTKRSILSITAQIFDPLGLLGPVIIVAKIIMQQLWSANLTWDEQVPQNIYTSWVRFRNSLQLLNEVKIPRYALVTDTVHVELHGFSDSSIKAYGACVYLRCKSSSNTYTSNLLCAKSRVAPLKPVTLPRLELCAAVLLAQLVTKIRSSLNISINKCYLWCDSTITLCWLRASPSKWKTFVANRVNEIQTLTSIDDWHHVKSNDNPADLLTRGVDLAQFISCDLWWKGPPWFADDILLENSPIATISIDSLPEQRVVVNTSVTVSDEFNLFQKYSSLSKLQRITAFCLRFISNSRLPKENREFGLLTTSELHQSLMRLIKLSQIQSITFEYNNLLNNKSIKRSSNLLSLNPFMDNDHIIRVGGRIKHSYNNNYDKKHPIILHPKHVLTKLIVSNEHIRLLHCGPQQLLASIRERYWPLSGRNVARGVVRRCITCSRVNPTSEQYLMGNLPSSRVNKFSPFYHTGVDYAGPYQIKDRKTRGAKLLKAYVCLFICLSTKAVHLELVSELTADAFLDTLKRFCARRGNPLHIYSDNATNFVGAYGKIQEFSNFLESSSQTIVNSLAKDNISWHFIPARSPTFGGLWEAGVKSTKHHLKRVMGNQTFTFEDFYTIIVQVEAVLNSRPLCPLTSDPNDNSPLTPAHFLIGKTLTAIPEPSVMNIAESRLNKYQRLQQIIEHFWSRWSKEYVSELQVRSKWKQQAANLLKLGSLVIIKEDNQPPLRWKIGRITNLHPGDGNIVRVVSVKIGDHIVKRAVNKLCVLPSDS